MWLNLSELKNNLEVPLTFYAPVSLKELEVDDIKAKGPVKISLTAAYDKEKREINLGGKFEAKIISTCHRCLKDFSFTFNESFHEILLENELESSDEDDFYSNGIINLIPFIRQHFLLKLPLKFICSEECPGICPDCGQDLLLEKCSCKSEKIDIRFEVLKSLIKDSES